MAILGWAEFARQADHGQFSVVDRDDSRVLPPQAFVDEMEGSRLHRPPAGVG